MFQPNPIIENYFAMAKALHDSEHDEGWQQGVSIEKWRKDRDAMFAYADEHGLTNETLTRYYNTKRGAYRASSVADAIAKMESVFGSR